jgi:hypothetical protein
MLAVYNFVPRDSPRVNVSVFVESLCVDSKDFFERQLMPAYEKLGDDVMNINVVSFGNAFFNTTVDGGEVLHCQHGRAECDANAYELCATDIFGQSRSVAFLACLFERLPMGHADTPYASFYFESCAQDTGLFWGVIENCHDDDARVSILQKEAANVTPKHDHVPWIVINGLHVSEENMDLLSEVCSRFEAAGGSNPACPSAQKNYQT